MFKTDRSDSRGEMAPQALVAFQHESVLCNAPAHKLVERVSSDRAPSSNGSDGPARSFSREEGRYSLMEGVFGRSLPHLQIQD